MKPRFTILMPVYARKDLYELFDRAIDSVYSNSILPDDFIVVVDGPVDVDFREKVLKFETEKKIRVIWLKVNVGLTKALNIGLKEVRTEWTVRADGDDYNLPYRFEEQLKYMCQDYDLIGGAIREVDRRGNVLAIRSVPVQEVDIKKFLMRRNPFNHMTVAFRTELVRKCGGYPDIYLKEDYSLWALMIRDGARTINSPRILVEATTGVDMYTRRGGWKYVVSEFQLQRHLVKCRVKGEFSAFWHGMMRSLVFLMPPFLRGAIYERFLRRAES